MENFVSGRKILKIFFIKLFTSDILNSVINIMLPIYISIRCTSFVNNNRWWYGTIAICIFIVLFNTLSIIIRKKQDGMVKNLNIIYKCYNDHCSINSEVASNIFRLNKIINNYLLDGNPVSKKVFDKIADFQTISFIICKRIQSLLRKEFGDEIQCEVTLMKKSENCIVNMIAYANNDNIIPSSYKKVFNLNQDKDINFIKIFNDLEGEIVCLPNRQSVEKEFKKLNGSKKREDAICQYIGIPIKTNRTEIELLLQVDVSKEKVFGKNREELMSFAKNTLYPYTVLLHKAYERDLIFNSFYDMIISVLAKQ